MEYYVFHIDVNSAFLSWEAVHRIKNGETIDLRTIASAIGGDEESRKGVILAKSTEAKKYGVVTGESLYNARRKCKDLVVAKSNFSLYLKCSKEFNDILKRYSKYVQEVSIDESFLFFEKDRIKGDPINFAKEISNEIKKELGFTVNIGISTNKILAKMASDFTKPDKIHTLYIEEIKSKMWPLKVSELFMVGKASVKKLNNLNIYTIGDLANYDINILDIHLKKHGRLIWNYANGINKFKLPEEGEREVKGVGNSTTLPVDITNEEDAYQIILSLAETVGMRLRKMNKSGKVITLEIKDNNFFKKTHQRNLKVATNITLEIAKVSKELFNNIWDRVPIRLIGIQVSKLQDADEYQYSLFDIESKTLNNNVSMIDKVDNKNEILINREENNKLDSAIDKIRNKYGMNIVVRGSFIKDK